ncbi:MULTISPECIES: hypothetical protein [unclassified Clostridium]|uniref:hypothetical protein n=1 Tax=unclassified Clostridium TaxID=2614128 RepID=UPI001106EE06|nr:MULTISPECIES: hypothetical protein [unclassified Clostridium]
MIPESIQSDNALILERLSLFLNGDPAAIRGEMVAELASACGVELEEGYRLLLASMLGLDMGHNPAHRALYHRYFPHMVHLLDPADFKGDAYLQNIRFPQAARGDWAFTTQSYQPYEAFVCDDFAPLPDGRVIPQIGYFAQGFSYPAVLQAGREWMTVTPNEIATMRAPLAAATGRVLTYGLGLGYFAYHAAQRPQVASLTVVEQDADAIALFEEYLLPQFPCRDKVEIVQADAFDFAASRMAAGRYDLVFCDLWHDPSDGVALYKRMKGFERLSPRSQFFYWIEQTLRYYI